MEAKRLVKYVVVTGGTLSGLGKGTTISSMGAILRSKGFRVTALKIDPYLNIDAGTMSPFEHGEVFVLRDGGEADLDLGNYERFMDCCLSRIHNMTTGRILNNVMKAERKGDYLGMTVQVVPHVTDSIVEWFRRVANISVDSSGLLPEIVFVEVGGTVGDIESAFYLEALQQFSVLAGRDMCLCHMTYIPLLGEGEQKTKPSQHSVQELRRAGLRPDFIFCRSGTPLTETSRRKISIHTQVPMEHVISVHDTKNVYRVPGILHSQNLTDLLLKRLDLTTRVPTTSNSPPRSLADWEWLAERVEDKTRAVTIGIVGKYTGMQDSYLSVLKALTHAGVEAGVYTETCWIESDTLQDTVDGHPVSIETREESWEKLDKCDAVLCPGGFGERGIIGKAIASKYCRETRKPYFGICLGLQTAVIDICRNVLGLEGANSDEFDKNAPYKACIAMPDVEQDEKGGTMRLGERRTFIKDSVNGEKTLASLLYDGEPSCNERHRHRFEVNPFLVSQLENDAGVIFSGKDSANVRMEIMELPRAQHPFFLGVQFHPEFTSRPFRANPCFLGFVLAAAGKLEERLAKHDGLRPGLAFTQRDKENVPI